MTGASYTVTLLTPARRAIAEKLAEVAAAAVLELCAGALAENPHRVGKRLFGPLTGCYGARRGTFRLIYRIDDENHLVTVLDVAPRSDVYRPR